MAALGAVLVVAGMYFGRRELIGAGVALILFPAAAYLWAVAAPLLSRRRPADPVRVISSEPTVWEPLRVRVSWGAGPVPEGTEHTRGLVPASIEHPGGELRYDVLPRIRGRHLLGPLVRHREDALGLVRSWIQLGGTTEVFVGPALTEQPPPERALELLGRAKGRGDSTPDTLTRPYRDGDPVRRIHWAVSARQGKLMVRPDAEDHEASPVLLLDRCAAHYPGARAHIRDGEEELELPAGFESALVSAAEFSRSRGNAQAPKLVFFPPLPPQLASHPLALARPTDSPAPPSSTATGGVILTGLPGASAAAWPAAWPARHVHVLLHAEEGRLPAPEVLAAWAAAGWTHSHLPATPPTLHAPAGSVRA